jgi:hypothetical protein
MKRLTSEQKTFIRQDRESGMTLTQLMKKYGLAKTTVFYVIRGCDSSKVIRAAPKRRVVVSVQAKKRPELSRVDLGEAARQMICARLMLAGVMVFRPMTEDTSIDLLVLKNNEHIVKCQCKYIYPTKQGPHAISLFSRRGGSKQKVRKHRYPGGEIDVFLGYCWDNDAVYVIPNADTGNKLELHLWILRKPVGKNQWGNIDAEQYKNKFSLLR